MGLVQEFSLLLNNSKTSPLSSSVRYVSLFFSPALSERRSLVCTLAEQEHPLRTCWRLEEPQHCSKHRGANIAQYLAQQQAVELDYAAIIQDHEFAWWNVSVNGLHISLRFELRFFVHFVTETHVCRTDGWMLLLYWYVLHVSLSRALFIAISER